MTTCCRYAPPHDHLTTLRFEHWDLISDESRKTINVKVHESLWDFSDLPPEELEALQESLAQLVKPHLLCNMDERNISCVANEIQALLTSWRESKWKR